MAVVRKNITLYKDLLKELQHIYSKGKLKDSSTYGYMKETFQKYQVTAEKICRGQKDVQHVAETYLCLLQSVRKHDELLKVYRGGGERTVESTANLVGFILPTAYTDKTENVPK